MSWAPEIQKSILDWNTSSIVYDYQRSWSSKCIFLVLFVFWPHCWSDMLSNTLQSSVLVIHTLPAGVGVRANHSGLRGLCLIKQFSSMLLVPWSPAQGHHDWVIIMLIRKVRMPVFSWSETSKWSRLTLCHGTQARRHIHKSHYTLRLHLPTRLTLIFVSSGDT